MEIREASASSFEERRRTVSQVVGYCGLLLIEAVSVGASVSSHTGNEALAAMIVGILASVPTANHCADRLFARLTRGYDGEQPV
jgi:hypothetical protein